MKIKLTRSIVKEISRTKREILIPKDTIIHFEIIDENPLEKENKRS